MAKKPSCIISDMEQNQTRFYPAGDVNELATMVASRNRGTANDYKPLLNESVKKGKIVRVKNANGKFGYASQAAVDAKNFEPVGTTPSRTKHDRVMRMPQPQMALA